MEKKWDNDMETGVYTGVHGDCTAGGLSSHQHDDP